MTYLLSDPRMSSRERVCAQNWLNAAIDAEDPALAAYWQNEGLAARIERLAGPDSEPIAEPPISEYKPRKATCPECHKPEHATPFACLL